MKNKYSLEELDTIRKLGSEVCNCWKKQDATCNLGPVEMYDHEGGISVEGKKEKQWVYFVCSKCKYQWALHKVVHRIKDNKAFHPNDYAFKQVELNFDFHLYEPDAVDVERIDDEVRILEINNCWTEFGIETDLDDKEYVHINFGFGGLKMKASDLKRGYMDWERRDKVRANVRKEK